jgi:hypothetical protein
VGPRNLEAGLLIFIVLFVLFVFIVGSEGMKMKR